MKIKMVYLNKLKIKVFVSNDMFNLSNQNMLTENNNLYLYLYNIFVQRDTVLMLKSAIKQVSNAECEIKSY